MSRNYTMRASWCRPVMLLFTLALFDSQSGNVLAQEQDIVGFYFDEAGLTTTAEVSEMEYILCWVVLQNISDPTGVYGVIMGGVHGENRNALCAWHLYGPQIDPCYQPWYINVDPAVANNAVIVIAYIGILAYPNVRDELFVTPALEDNPPWFDGSEAVYWNNAEPQAVVPLHPASGSYDLPVAVINPQAVSTDDRTWGEIKGLFR